MVDAKSIRELMFAEIRRVREEAQETRKLMAQANPTVQVSSEEDYVPQNSWGVLVGTLRIPVEE